jgi:hypothetical protein
MILGLMRILLWVLMIDNDWKQGIHDRIRMKV